MKQLNWGLAAASSLILAGIMASPGAAAAGNTRFSDFTPLPSSAGPTSNEAAPDHVRQPCVPAAVDRVG